MQDILILVIGAALAFLLFKLSSAREMRRMIDLAEAEFLAGTTGPNYDYFVSLESVLALLVGAACMIPGIGAAFAPISIWLLVASRRATPQTGKFAISHWFNTFAAGFTASGLLVSAIAAASAVMTSRPFEIAALAEGPMRQPDGSPFTTASILAAVPAIIMSVTFHECGHGLIALAMGDDTARKSGRITLNPIRHIDPFGSILLPLLLIAMKANFMFGWARPVPVRGDKLRNPNSGAAAVSAAGAGANFVLAAISLGLFTSVGAALSISGFGEVSNFSAMAAEATVFGSAFHPLALTIHFLKIMVILNLSLGILNLIPVPPLDGSKLLEGLWPSAFSPIYSALRPAGCLIAPLFLGAGFCMLVAVVSPVLILIFHVFVPFFVRL